MDKKWWTLIAVGTGTFMLLLDVTIVTVAQPGIQSGLHASFTDIILSFRVSRGCALRCPVVDSVVGGTRAA